jgi:hypothetical protein
MVGFMVVASMAGSAVVSMAGSSTIATSTVDSALAYLLAQGSDTDIRMGTILMGIILTAIILMVTVPLDTKGNCLTI